MSQINQKLNKALRRVCEERLLPNLISSMSQQLKSQTKLDYKRYVIDKYKQQLRVPRHYNPEQGKTKRQLFQQKLQKVLNHQIPIEYCGVMTTQDGKKVITYNGNPLDSVPVETKQEFKVFKDFSYDNFIKDKLNIIWDEHANQRNQQKIYNPYQITKMIDKRNRIHTVNEKPLENKPKPITKQSKQPQRSHSRIEKNKIKSQPTKLPMIIQIPRLKQRSKTKVMTGRMICKNQNQSIQQQFKMIGGYNKYYTEDQSITKQSIVKHLKKYLFKPIRIVDFLEIKAVETLQSYILLVKRLKNMPRKHRNFLCFLFYDTNNDAIICQNDLSRLKGLARNPKHMQYDYDNLIKIKYQQKMEIPPEFDLFRLPQITQTSYFNFIQKSLKGRSQVQFDKLVTEETYQGDSVILTLKKRYRIDFQKFQKTYKDAKPGLWYLLMDVLGGIKYEGVKYY